jgi:hypothetical protein
MLALVSPGLAFTGGTVPFRAEVTEVRVKEVWA